MPSVLIETRHEHTEEMELKMMEAVHSALRESFRILAHDRNVRLIAHKPHRFQCPPGKSNPEMYTHISIDCFAGRSLDAKRNLYRGIVRNLGELGIPSDHIKILCARSPQRTGASVADRQRVMWSWDSRLMYKQTNGCMALLQDMDQNFSPCFRRNLFQQDGFQLWNA
jgi:hypothetical protein